MLLIRIFFVEPRKPKLPGKWDAIMNSIAEGRQKKSDVDLADRVREAKSKVFADFRPPVIRSRMTTPGVNFINILCMPSCMIVLFEAFL